MAKRLYSLDIRGKRTEWSFQVFADPRHVEDWRADGLHVNEVLNVIPQWYVNLGLPVRAWCFLEDLFNFKNPFV